MSNDFQPPRDDLFRAVMPGASVRNDEGTGRPIMYGHFAVFNEWAEIDSAYEGRFLEKVAPGAFAKTIAENRGNMRVLFHHGRDSLGLQVLGEITELREDEKGAYYEVALFDGIPPLVLSGLRAGEYGASYRFRAMRDEKRNRPGRSTSNPNGLPERTIIEARVPEFGPTPFPAFAGATSGVRSISDEILLSRLAEHPEGLERLVARTGISLNGLTSLGSQSDGEARDRVAGDSEDLERRSSRLYERSVDFVGTSAWAMQPEALSTVMQILAERAAGHRPSEEEIRERIGTRAQPDSASPSSPVRVIQIDGGIVPKATFFTEVSGGTSIEQFRSEFNEALASADVKAIILNIDSPGGSAALVPEMGAEILAARGTKPIVASVNTYAASAAYWLAAQADEIAVTPSGKVGSIGVWSAHTDISAAQEKAGVKTTLISAGKYKVDGNPFEPLTESARENLQADVDAFYEMFLQAVADGRGVDVDTVKSDFGQGRMVMAVDAVKAGMADRVETFNDTLSRLESEHGASNTPAAPAAPITPPDDAAQAANAAHLETGRRESTSTLTRKEKPSWLL